MAPPEAKESGQSSPMSVDEKDTYNDNNRAPSNDIEACPGRLEEPDGMVHKVLSKTLSRSSWKDPGPPPDGGAEAWIQAAMAHLIVVNTWGYITSFGVFQTFYIDYLDKSPSAISWIGAVQIFLLFFIGTFSGRATDYGLFKLSYSIGAILQLLGVFMSSLSTKYWHLFLAQGICIGIGDGLVFCPAISLLSTYFSKKRGLALAIAASGTATGGLIYPAIAEKMLPTAGFAWTVRTQGFVMLALHLISFTFTKTRLPPRKAGALIEWSAFKDLSYTFFALGMFLVFWGLYFAFYYIGSFGRNVIGINQQASINNLLIINGVGIFGRLIPNHLADRFFGPLNILIPFAFCAGLLLYCWTAVASSTGLIAFAVVYGIAASGIQSLFPATLASLTEDMSKVGVRIGMTFTVVSFAALTGAPLAGALVERHHGGYVYAQVFAGTTMMCGTGVLVLARVCKTGRKARVKV